MQLLNRSKFVPAVCLLLLGAWSVTAQHSSPVPALEETGFQSIFDGKSLQGWDCDGDFWRVSDGAIVGESTLQHQPKQNIFCIWKGGQPADFELKAEYRLTGVNDGNSGIQYRSVELPDVAKWVMKGYQFDIDLKQQYTGQIYEERGRGFPGASRANLLRARGKESRLVGIAWRFWGVEKLHQGK